MEQEQITEVMTQLIDATRNFLVYAMKKSGIRGNLNELGSLVSLTFNDNKMRSFLLGEYMPPAEDNPNGEIRLHLDAIVDYSEYLGVEYWSLVAKVLFCQVHHALSYKPSKLPNFQKAEKFATKICKKLARQQIILDPRPKVYIGPEDKLTITARQKWIEKWLGEGYKEAYAEETPPEKLPEGSEIPKTE